MLRPREGGRESELEHEPSYLTSYLTAWKREHDTLIEPSPLLINFVSFLGFDDSGKLWDSPLFQPGVSADYPRGG